jgi:hypothetical protein
VDTTDLATAIVDRILERGRLLKLDGPSIRTKHLGLDDPTEVEASTQPARISGIRRQEFPEPTASTRSAWPNQAHHADRAQLAHADDAEIAITFAEPGAISEGEP